MKKIIAFCLALTLFGLVANAQTKKTVVVKSKSLKIKSLKSLDRKDVYAKLKAAKAAARKEGE